MTAIIAEQSDAYILVIDTDRYAGNFERQLVAFMTGEVGECGVGDEAAQRFAEDVPAPPFGPDLIAHEPDEHGCCRPASIWVSPYYWNNAGHHYPNATAIDDPRVLEDHENRRLEDIEHTKRVYEHLGAEQVAEILERGTPYDDGPKQYPAYCSVACFLNEHPAHDVLSFLVERAKLFCAEQEIGYLGARLLCQQTVEEVLAQWIPQEG